MENDKELRKGMKVEARREEHGFEGIWYHAKILDILQSQDIVYVQYNTPLSEEIDELKAFVKLSNLRPRQPNKDNIDLKPGNAVEAFRDGGWVEGRIKKAGCRDGSCDKLVPSSFLVSFSRTGEELEFERYKLRRSAEWFGGCRWRWKDDEVICGTSEIKFPKGTTVEVCKEGGFAAAWYEANIVNGAGENSFVLEHCDLRSDDGITFLRENVDSEHIRPYPNPLVRDFSMHEKVDAWHESGWREGMISNILNTGCVGRKYIVSFPNTDEVLEFDPWDLRYHEDWINGAWIKASQV